MYKDDYPDPYRSGRRAYENGELTSARGNGVHYTLAALMVVVLAVGGLIFASGSVPHPELANAPDRGHEIKVPPAPPAPRLPSVAPDAPPGAPTMAPAAPALPKQ